MSATGSSPRRSRSQSTSMSYGTSPTHPSSKRAFSAAASPRNIGHRGKRARKGNSPSPRQSPPVNTLDYYSTAPTPAPLITVFTNFASSAPPTPLLPSSSSAFFPAASSISHTDSYMQSSSPSSPRQSRAKLDDLHREAFTSLRQSLAQSGEGFLRRMREWEQRRNNMESSKAHMLGSRERGRDRRRARRRRTSHTDHRTAGGIPTPHPHDDNYLYPSGISHPAKEPDAVSAYGIFPSGDSDVEDDMLVDSVGHPLSLAPAERKSRSVSLGRPPVDVPGSPELFAVELAESERYPSAHYTTTFDFPVTYSDTRSSSPFSLGNTSDDESSIGSRYDHTHSGFSSPRAMSKSVDWSVLTRIQSGVSFRSGVNAHHSSPCTSRPPSPRFSPSRLTALHMSIPSLGDTSMHKDSLVAAVSEIMPQAPQTDDSDKALTALVLALETGSGSLADYGHVREAQGELEELEAGALWE